MDDHDHKMITTCYTFDRLTWKFRQQFKVNLFREPSPLSIWWLSGENGSDINLCTPQNHYFYSAPIAENVTFSEQIVKHHKSFINQRDALSIEYFAFDQKRDCKELSHIWRMDWTVRGVTLQRSSTLPPLCKTIDGISLCSLVPLDTPLHAFDGSGILLRWACLDESKHWYQYLDLTRSNELVSNSSFSELLFQCSATSDAHLEIPNLCLHAAFPWIVRFLKVGHPISYQIELYDKIIGRLVRTIYIPYEEETYIHLLPRGMLLITKKSNHQIIFQISDILWRPAHLFELARRFRLFSRHLILERNLLKTIVAYC